MRTSPVTALLFACTTAAVPALPSRADAHGRPAGAVYTMTNAIEGNEIVRFERDRGGALVETGRYATDGRGNGGGLGSQGAIALAHGGRLLLAVNAGSDDVSVFAVEADGLRLVDRAAAGGTAPISVAARGDRVYVLEAGGDGDVAAMRLHGDGHLEPMGDPQPLSRAGSAPAQVAVTPDGDALVVTEKATGCIDLFPLDGDGAIGPGACHPSSGRTPFGFDFAEETLLVAEAQGGAPLGSSASSYRLHDGAPRPVSASVPTTQTAACWLIATPDGRYAFTANAGSNSISTYAVGPRGALTLLHAATPSGGLHPIDEAVTPDGRLLYVLDNTSGMIAAFGVDRGGALTPAGVTSGLPRSSAGLVAR